MISSYRSFVSFNRKYRESVLYLQTEDPHSSKRLNKCNVVVIELPGLLGRNGHVFPNSENKEHYHPFIGYLADSVLIYKPFKNC